MNWKKAVSVLLVSAMALSVTACGDDSQTGNSGGGDSVAAGTEASGGDAASAGTSGGDAASVDTSNADLVVWTLSDDLKQFAEKYKEETGKHVEVVVTEPENYPTKVQTAIMAGEVEPDVFVGEPQMLQDFYDIGAFADLNELGAQDYAEDRKSVV